MLRFTKKRAAVFVSTLAAAGVAAVAVAFFTSTGEGTGHATVGSATHYAVTVNAPEGGPLYPGSGTVTVKYSVKNEGSGNQQLGETKAHLTVDGEGGVYDTTAKAFNDECKASWFTVENSAPGLPDDLAGGASYTEGSATVTMQDSKTRQDACQGLTPQVTVEAK